MAAIARRVTTGVRFAAYDVTGVSPSLGASGPDSLATASPPSGTVGRVMVLLSPMVVSAGLPRRNGKGGPTYLLAKLGGGTMCPLGLTTVSVSTVATSPRGVARQAQQSPRRGREETLYGYVRETPIRTLRDD